MQASCSAPLAAARRLPALPARAAQLRSAPVSKAVQQAEAGTSSSQIGKASEGEEIYIGFKKEDGFGDRTGRKGRVIKDDPRKYPGREDMGPFLSVVGGWAGGEVGLWQIREEAKKELEAKQAPAKSKSDKPTVIRSGNGKDEIYIGFQKEDGFGDRTGRKGRVVIDDARKYPGKEDLGPFLGATGGFAAGEKGIRMLVEQGELRLRGPNDPVKKQVSPLAIGALVVAAAAGGGILLTDIVDVGEELVDKDILEAPIDDKTKTLLLAAIAVLGATGAIASGRAAISTLQDRLKDGAQNLVLTAAFFFALFIAARAVLEL